ncbi:TVP38/TMEM64 family protein [Stackebrandtia albiflava]|uniref:TVP38/TMEM64 family protein n=1 Tax=Stackebrandtia albiflava TaxID=406432 RepID=UPI001315AD9F|nr:TVP38/TMEM64 family protein [Stackebrandtia albiflava]
MKTAHQSRAALWRFGSLVGGIVVLAALMLLAGPPDAELLRARVADLGGLGPWVAVVGVATGILMLVPRTVMSITSGLLFGWLPGFCYIMIGSLLGATIGFVIGRLLGREFVAQRLERWASRDGAGTDGRRAALRRWTERQLANVDAWLGRSGFVGMWIVRVIPLSHFGFTSYAAGTTTVRYRHFAIGTLLGALPSSLGYTAVGGAILGAGGLPMAMLVATGMSLFSVTVALVVRRRLLRGR